jgi:hypothetical protein
MGEWRYGSPLCEESTKAQFSISNFLAFLIPKFNLILEEVVVVYFKVFSWLVLEQNKKNIIRHSWPLDRDVNPEFPEYEARVLSSIFDW